MHKIEAVIFDWAGTTVDFGCFAPLEVFINIFKKKDIDVSIEEARKPMGMLKIDHIRTMLEMDNIEKQWTEKYNRKPNETDVEELYEAFETELMSSLKKYTDPIEHVVTTINKLKENGIKIGSTTGYTKEMMEVVTEEAKKKGYAPDYLATAEDVGGYGRPYPYMIFENIKQLGIPSIYEVIKVGDTVSDIKEAKNAGLISVGVVDGSSIMGLNEEEFNEMNDEDKNKHREKVKETFKEAGADYTILNLGELPKLIEDIEQK